MRWRILILLATARLALGLQFQTLASTSEYLIADFALDYTQIGTLIGLFMLPGLFFAIPAGFAGRWASDRVLTTSGMACICLGGVIAATADGATQIGVGRIVSGIGFVTTTIYLTKMVTDWFVGKEIATALGILVMTWPLGIAIGQIGHEWLAANIGWSTAFWAASAYAAFGTALVGIFYRAPQRANAAAVAAPRISLGRNEVILILAASLVWSLFNAGYVVYLSFAPKLLVSGGMGALAAAAIISVASYLMMFSGIVCGQLADRTRKPDVILYVCMAGAVAALLMLQDTSLALASSLVFGLMGMAPAGLIVALTAEAMRPQNRAFGMGLYFSVYFIVAAPAPTIAGWLFDRSGDAFHPVLFAASLFFLTAVSNVGFRILKQRTPLEPSPA